MNTALMAGGTAVAILLVVAALIASTELVRHAMGRLLLFAAVAVVPLALSGGGVVAGVKRSSETEFCISCHEMQDYGKSLFVDNVDSLAAVHYQKRLIDRGQTCFECHTDYAMFGDIKAKMNGLRHVYVHYVTGPPEKLELYQPYPNYNCLHCHDDARAYLEVEVHREESAALRSDQKSCLECHDVGHDLDGVKNSNFWQAEVAQ